MSATAQVTWTGAGADRNFTNAGNWSAALPNDGSASVAFGTTAATSPVVNMAYSVGSLAFQSNSPSFTVNSAAGAALTVLSSITQNSSAYQTIAAPLTVGPNFSFSGPGSQAVLNVTGGLTGLSGFGVTNGLNLRASGNWNVAGALTVQSGSVLEFVNTDLTIGNAITNNGAVGFGNGTNTLTYTGVMSGAGTVTVNSPTKVTGANTYSGATTVARELVADNSSGSATGSGTVNVANGGVLRIGTGGATGAIAGAIVDNGQVYYNRSDAVTAGGISGTGGVHQSGSGTLTLLGTNSYTGQTYVESGTLTDGAANAFRSGSDVLVSGGTLKIAYNETIRVSDSNDPTTRGNVTIAPGAVLTLSGSSKFSGAVNGGGALTIANGVYQTLTGNVTHTGGTTIASGGTLQIGDGVANGSVAGDITNNNRLVFAPGDANATYAGKISGTGTVSVAMGSDPVYGTITLTGASSYAGSTMINSGTLKVGAANALPTTTTVWVSDSGTLEIAGNQTIAKLDGSPYGGALKLDGGNTLTIAPAAGAYGGTFAGEVSGSGALAVSGAAGSGFTLSGSNSYSGGTTIGSGTLYVGDSASLGTGTIAVQSGAGLGLAKDTSWSVVLPNEVNVAGNVTLTGGRQDRNLVLAGNVTLPAAGATLQLNDTVEFGGRIQSTGSGATLAVQSGGTGFGYALLTGSIDTSKVSSVTVNSAGLVFASTTSVPTTTSLVSGSNAYVGIANVAGSAPSVASVVNLIDKARFSGVLGFDTPGERPAPAVFGDAITLTGLGANVSLGSASSAVLSGTITPDGDYLFGNGAGVLVVTSKLTGAHGLTVNSNASIPGNTLTLVLRNTASDGAGGWVDLAGNDFTGAVTVTNSQLVLDSATALPAGRTVTLGANGYLGYTEAFTGAASFADFIKTRLAPGGYVASSVIGLDSHEFVNDQLMFGSAYSDRVVSETIDLRALSSIYLGTVSSTTVTGVIFAPTQNGANKTLSLLAAGDGTLTIESPLRAGNVNRLVVGSATSPYAKGTVTLTGANTYRDGTSLQSGTLKVTTTGKITTAGPLGTGTLTVPANANRPTLATDEFAYLNNPIALGSALQLGMPALRTPETVGAQSANLSYYTGGLLFLNGVISDLDALSHGSLEVYGRTYLMAANTFSGGVTLHDATVTLGNDAALGTGTLTFGNSLTSYSPYGSTVLTNGQPRTIANNLVYAGNRRGYVTFGGAGAFTFNGSFSLQNDVTIASGSSPLTFNGPISGFGRFITSGTAPVILGGSNSYTGGTESISGAIVFANAGAMPASPTQGAFAAGGAGYVGIAFVPSNLQSGFIDRFDKPGTSGAIGFDSSSASAPNTFAGAIDLRGFDSAVRLGSASSAVLTGAITPAGSSYNFGNGGGLLTVQSSLVDASTTSPRSVNVSSYGNPLTVRLAGTNTFTGGVSVYNSGLVFGSGSLPATGTIQTSWNAYVGTEDPAFAVNPAGFIGRFASTTQQTIIGFDGLNVTGALSLAGFGVSVDPTLFIGTSTQATISGPITLPSGQTSYRFAGYKGGQLTVATTLSGANGVIIGDASWPATGTNPSSAGGALSTVTLAGTNTYTGGTALNAGVLNLASDSALGTGALTISGYMTTGDRHLGLFAVGGARTLPATALVLGSAKLDIGGDQNLTLGGPITGGNVSALYKTGTGALKLSGDNSSFAGTVVVNAGAIEFVTGTSVGTGALEFATTNGGTVTFDDTATVNGISGSSAADRIVLTPANAAGTVNTLTITQLSDGDFAGAITGSTGGLVLNGGGSRLKLSGASTFSGPVTVQEGITVLAANAAALGATTNTVKLNGGKLALDSGVVLQNPIVLNAGRLGGIGTFKTPVGGAGFTITSGIVLSPGLGGPGTLSFDGVPTSGSLLALGSGGAFHWQLSDATNTTGGWDQVVVNGTVSVTATATAPFLFKLTTVGADGGNSFAANFDPAQAYSWTVLKSNGLTGFTNANQIVLDTSLFLNPNTGTFSLVQLNNDLVLNFSPVPEPSTYAMLIAGLGVTLVVSRRRRPRR